MITKEKAYFQHFAEEHRKFFKVKEVFCFLRFTSYISDRISNTVQQVKKSALDHF